MSDMIDGNFPGFQDAFTKDTHVGLNKLRHCVVRLRNRVMLGSTLMQHEALGGSELFATLANMFITIVAYMSFFPRVGFR